MIDQSTTGIQSILKAEFSLQNIRSFISCTVFASAQYGNFKHTVRWDIAELSSTR